MSPREFWNCYEGWNKLEENRQKQHWERTRYASKSNAFLHTSKKDKERVNNAFKLPWDDGGKNMKFQKEAWNEERHRLEQEETLRIIKEKASKKANGS